MFLSTQLALETMLESASLLSVSDIKLVFSFHFSFCKDLYGFRRRPGKRKDRYHAIFRNYPSPAAICEISETSEIK